MKRMKRFGQRWNLRNNNVLIAILLVISMISCNRAEQHSNDLKCIFSDSLHRFEYYRGAKQIIIRVDSNLFYFTSDNRLVKVYTRSVVNGKRMFVNGKVYYFDRKSGTLDSVKSYQKNKLHGYSVVYDRAGKIISARKFDKIKSR